jgi:hypothetical protein
MDQNPHSIENMATTSFDSSPEHLQQPQSEFVEGQKPGSIPGRVPDDQQQNLAKDTMASAVDHRAEDGNLHSDPSGQPSRQATNTSITKLVRFDSILVGLKC